jgi:hypothetical protein
MWISFGGRGYLLTLWFTACKVLPSRPLLIYLAVAASFSEGDLAGDIQKSKLPLKEYRK